MRSLLTGVSVAAVVAGSAFATPYRLERHGYIDQAGKMVITSSKVTPVGGHGRKTKPVYTTYSYTYSVTATAPLKVATIVTGDGYFTQTTSGACIGYPAGKFKLAVTSDANGKWSAHNLPAATIPYTGTAVTCSGGNVITGFNESVIDYSWTNKTAVAGTTTDTGTATYTLKTLDYGSTTNGFIEINIFDSTITYCGIPAKGTTTCPTTPR
jgi:hypothetical protein